MHYSERRVGTCLLDKKLSQTRSQQFDFLCVFGNLNSQNVKNPWMCSVKTFWPSSHIRLLNIQWTTILIIRGLKICLKNTENNTVLGRNDIQNGYLHKYVHENGFSWVAQTYKQIKDEFLRVLNRKHMIFWVVKSCLHFRVKKNHSYSKDTSSRFLLNLGTYLPDYTKSHCGDHIVKFQTLS
jgi:hypothetical protein